MTFPRARLIISACLFLGWLGFLLHLVVESSATIVSRPQFLVASLWVVAEVLENDGRPESRVALDTILWSALSADQELEGRQIEIPELAMYGQQEGYVGAGKYILPLTKVSVGTSSEYAIAAIPFANGYPRLQPTMASVELVRVGDNPSQVAQYMTQVAKWTKKDADAALARFSKHQDPSLIIARRLPLRDAYHLRKELTAAGAQCSVREECVKIYPLTPQTRAQIEEIKRARR